MIFMTQLPSYVDDVIEVTVAEDKRSATVGGESVTPKYNNIYLDVTQEKIYRWTGTMYDEIMSVSINDETCIF